MDCFDGLRRIFSLRIGRVDDKACRGDASAAALQDTATHLSVEMVGRDTAAATVAFGAKVVGETVASDDSDLLVQWEDPVDNGFVRCTVCGDYIYGVIVKGRAHYGCAIACQRSLASVQVDAAERRHRRRKKTMEHHERWESVRYHRANSCSDWLDYRCSVLLVMLRPQIFGNPLRSL